MELPFIPLEGRFVRLEPFAPELKAELRALVDSDVEAWAIMPVNPTGARFDAFFEAVCAAPPGVRLPYAIRRRSDGRMVGTSTFYTAGLSERGVEIGTSFLHPQVRSGAVNPEAKLLMMSHAFASGAVRVAFRVDTRNTRSQAAVTKLGAVREGVLRKDRVTWTGYIRDTVIFSVIEAEWPAVRAGLEARLAAY
jgi:RimJ/RimL family protein N-acetyltransferase